MHNLVGELGVALTHGPDYRPQRIGVEGLQKTGEGERSAGNVRSGTFGCPNGRQLTRRKGRRVGWGGRHASVVVVAIVVGFPFPAGVGRRGCRHYGMSASSTLWSFTEWEQAEKRGVAYLYGRERVEGARSDEEAQEAWPPGYS